MNSRQFPDAICTHPPKKIYRNFSRSSGNVQIFWVIPSAPWPPAMQRPAFIAFKCFFINKNDVAPVVVIVFTAIFI